MFPDSTGVMILALSTSMSLLMTGLVWFVQVVHYPLFLRVGRTGFTTYAATHSRLTSILVVPLMLIELATSLWLLVSPPAAISGVTAIAQFALLLLIWGSTFALQVPLHRRLGDGYDRAVVRRLVASNWIRTGLWSTRSVVLLISLL